MDIALTLRGSRVQIPSDPYSSKFIFGIQQNNVSQYTEIPNRITLPYTNMVKLNHVIGISLIIIGLAVAYVPLYLLPFPYGLILGGAGAAIGISVGIKIIRTKRF